MVTYRSDQPCTKPTTFGAETYNVTALLLDHLREEGFESMEMSNSVDAECPDGWVSRDKRDARSVILLQFLRRKIKQ